MTDPRPTDVPESVMAGHGYYSKHSQPQQAAAEPAFAYLQAAADEAPIVAAELRVLDMGCAGGQNEMAPLGMVVERLRARDESRPIVVAHTDLPQNDFGPLFELLGSDHSYTAGAHQVFPIVIGRTLYGPLVPSHTVSIAWTAITLHWLSRVPIAEPGAVFSNLVEGPAREHLARQAASDWTTFLRERARELVDDGELVLIAGASDEDGVAGAEGLFGMVEAELDALVAAGALRAQERRRVFYPTWNRTPREFLAPFDEAPVRDELEVIDHRADATDDATSYPQYHDHRDAAGFAAAYITFVRAVTEVPLFRSLDRDRDEQARSALRTQFYGGLQERIAADPETATCHWRTFSMRIRRRPR